MEYFGNEVDGKDLGIVISTLDGCLPCMALLGCDCQSSAAQMMMGLGADDKPDANLQLVTGAIASAGTTIFGAWQTAEAAKATARAGIEAAATKTDTLVWGGVAVVGLVAAAFIVPRFFRK